LDGTTETDGHDSLLGLHPLPAAPTEALGRLAGPSLLLAPADEAAAEEAEVRSGVVLRYG
jgi:hypothetical protein